MDVSFVPVDLDRWDQCVGDLFVVGVWSDVRPLRGAAGLLDWRLCGNMSRWIGEGRLQGTVGEKTLVPTHRVPFRALLAIGLGASPDFSEEGFLTACGTIADTARGLRLSSVFVAPPGRDLNRIAPERALDLLTEILGRAATIKHLGVIDDPNPAPARPRR